MRILLLLLLFGSVTISAQARNVAGIPIEEQVNITDKISLRLNGAGIRTKFIFNIYVGALYVTQPVLSTPQQVYADPLAQRMLMHFLYDEVSKDKLNNGWQEGFENNLDDNSFAQLKTRLHDFKGFFQAVKKGDEIFIDYLPDHGTRVSINSEIKGFIPGNDFHQALMKVWLGDKPADWELKEALLGN